MDHFSGGGSLYAHAKTKTGGRGTHVVLNASEFMDEWVMNVADTVELFEGGSRKI